MQTITMREMMQAGLHFGHLTRFRNPKMSRFIFGESNQISIINLEKTLPMFKTAVKFVEKLAARGGKILFVGTKHAARKLLAEYAQKCDMPYVDHRWLGGMLTNYKTIKQSIRRLEQLQQMEDDGTLEHMTKKEALNLTREKSKLASSLGGIKDMGGLPDALFIVDVGYEKIAVKEANRLRIPVVGVVDTNSSPEGIDYLIPGNDDAMRAIRFYLAAMTDVIIEARESQRASLTNQFQEEFVEVDDEAGSQEPVEADEANKGD